MEQLIYAFASKATEPEAMILVESIREFAGSLANCPIWLFTSEKRNDIPESVLEKLEQLGVEIHTLDLSADMIRFPFVGHVFAAKLAEDFAVNKTANLVFLGTNTIVAQKPKEFLLDRGVNLAYRPVHHTLIGSIFDKPLDEFWNLIYEKTMVKEEKVFPMQTHVDGNILRPYINSGYLIVKPERGFFNEWWRYYSEIYNDPDFYEFYKKDDLYLTFIHQAVLSGVFVSYLNREEVQELPFEYNYPANLYLEISDDFKPQTFTDLVTIRYYLAKILKIQEYEKIPFEEPLKSWLSSRLHRKS